MNKWNYNSLLSCFKKKNPETKQWCSSNYGYKIITMTETTDIRFVKPLSKFYAESWSPDLTVFIHWSLVLTAL